MSAYCLFDDLEVFDPEKLKRYRAEVGESIERFGGRYLVIGGDPIQVEGERRLRFPVMIRFSDMPKARDWYDSKAYRELKALRQSAVASNAVFLNGFEV